MFVKDKEDLERFYRGYPLHICPICGIEFRYNHESVENEYVELNIKGFTKTINRADICNNCSFNMAHLIRKNRIPL